MFIRPNYKCSMCDKPVDVLEQFSKGECLECHEKNFESDGEIPDFTKAINI